MREILFKAKRIDNGEWVEGYYVSKRHREIKDFNPVHQEYNYKMSNESIPFLTRGEKWYKIKPETLCQFTGLTDSKGVKIFEWDKFVFNSRPYQISDTNCFVYFHKGAFRVFNETDTTCDRKDRTLSFYLWETSERKKGSVSIDDYCLNVKGNIHDE